MINAFGSRQGVSNFGRVPFFLALPPASEWRHLGEVIMKRPGSGKKVDARITLVVVLAIVLAVVFVLYFRDLAAFWKIVGELLLRLLKMVISPLIFASVYVSVSGLGSLARIREIGLKTMVYYLLTTSLAVLTGLVFVNLFHPGLEETVFKAQAVEIKEFRLADLLLGLVPLNPFKSLAEGKVLQITFFALFLGFATLALPEARRRLLFDFFEAVIDALIRLIRWIIWLTPLGVFAIVSSIVAEKGLSPLLALSKYVATVVCGRLFHGVLTLGAVLWFFTRTAPWNYLLKVREALLVAFSTASSSATLPISLEVAEEKAKVPKKIAGFVLPLGSTINMDGTALYEAVAAMFIANVYQVPLGPAEQITIFLTATLASIGAAGIPSAGLVTMTMVLQAVGLPLEGIGLLLAVDRFLDMLRTSVNVWGDPIGARVIARLARFYPKRGERMASSEISLQGGTHETPRW
jgi:Na+/H+-dicarboxylate symporter